MEVQNLVWRWAAIRKRDEESATPKTIEMHMHFPFRVVMANSIILLAGDGTRFIQQRVLASKWKPINAERMLEEFLALKHNDAEILSFLDRYGLWEDEQPVEVKEFWDLQEFLRMLLLLNPRTRGRFLSRSGFNKLPGPLHKGFTLDFEYSEGGLHFVVNTTSCLEAIIALAQIDLVNKTKRRKCARKDCPVVFSVSTGDKRKDKRKYHDRKCRHVEVVRRSRASE